MISLPMCHVNCTVGMVLGMNNNAPQKWSVKHYQLQSRDYYEALHHIIYMYYYTVFYLNLVNNKLLQLNHLSGQNDILESFAQNYLSN